MENITSLQNPRVKDAVRLRDARHRQKQGRMLIDGARELLRAIDSGIELKDIFVFEPACRSNEARSVLQRLEVSGDRACSVSEAVFEKLAFGDRAEGLVAVAKTPDLLLDDFRLPDNSLVAVLEGVEKPGNVGAVLRSADGAGIDGLVVADGATDLYNPNAIRASLGTIFDIEICQASAAETFDWLKRQRLQIVAARVEGAVAFTEVDFRRPSAIVLGSEASGLSDLWQGPGVVAASLPMLGIGDSLNVSAAAAVFFYEARRQRGVPPGDRD